MSRPTFNLGPFLEKENFKTNGTNFMSWFCTLRILLAPYKMVYVLEATVGDAPSDNASEDDKNAYQSKLYDSSFIHSGMLYAMEVDLKVHFDKKSAYDIITDLKAVYGPQAKA